MGATRPSAGNRQLAGAGLRRSGITVGLIGWVVAMIGLALSITTAFAVVQGGPKSQQVALLEALSFGVAITALGVGKTGIALVLTGIVRRIGVRLASIKAALPALVAARSGIQSRPSYGEVKTPHGRALTSAQAPAPLFVHRMARVLWAPMLVMGAMIVALGFVLSLLQSQSIGTDLAQTLDAWVKGTLFLGEGFLLAAISFLLGTILGAIRGSGGEVQQSLGVTVKTLRMPTTAKFFLALMVTGLMIEIVQFLGYAHVAQLTDSATIITYKTWLGPLREMGLGILLTGVVLALATIAKALNFQFSRIQELITTGQ